MLVNERKPSRLLHCVAVCCSVLQCVAVCCSVLQRVAACCSMLQCVAACCSMLQCNERTPSSVLQSVALCCRELRCVAVRFSVFQCVAVPLASSSIHAKHTNALHLTATPCNTQMDTDKIQHLEANCNAKDCNTLEHCNTLQLSAAHCSILQHCNTL